MQFYSIDMQALTGYSLSGTQVYYKNFAWQVGYAGYSVSQSKVEVVKRYIERQKEHHKKISFREEYLKFLREYSVGFDEKYLWT